MAREARDRDRALAQTSSGVALVDTSMEIDDDNDNQVAASGQEAVGSKVVVIHPGSQNLRIGLASDALPKTIPMVIARRWPEDLAEDSDEEPRPKRHKLDGEIPEEPEKWFGEEVYVVVKLPKSLRT
jgi:actin-related protein 8